MKNKNEITQNLGLALKYYREDRGLSLAELSEVSDVSPSYINRIEKGERKSPSIVLLHQIAKGLNVQIETLLDIAKPIDDLELHDLAQIIIKNDFTIDGKAVTTETKKNIIDLLEFIILSPKNTDKNKMIYGVLEKIDKLKDELES